MASGKERSSAGPSILIMADYGCFTWTHSDSLLPFISCDLNDNLDLVRLGASHELFEKFKAWHAEWEQQAYGDVPLDPAAADSWERRGWVLAQQLQDELPKIEVQVWDQESHRSMPIPGATRVSTYRLQFDCDCDACR